MQDEDPYETARPGFAVHSIVVSIRCWVLRDERIAKSARLTGGWKPAARA